ncbi:MAG: histone deacetylase [candidate division Zixibacteria bacterium]|nr:histone deacetylase [candidate division Zixibacteria bacterium]
MMSTGLVYHPDYLLHDTGAGHPESKERLTSLMQHLEKTGLLSQLKLIQPNSNSSLEWVKKVHSPDYVDLVKQTCEKGNGMLDPDTVVSKDSFNVALLAVEGVLNGVEEVMGSNLKNVFCAIRPPGHHAEKERGMGFCIFNNVAIAAQYLLEKHKLNRILIVDWDAHHGNGTQNIFYSDPRVYYFSIHQFPYYPGTGKESEEGENKGKGFTFNMPMAAGSGDLEYIEVFENILSPLALKFSPEFILISAGFDAHQDDPLTGLKVSTKGFKKMTQVTKKLADSCCQGRIVSVLEGGYHLKSLCDSVETHLRVLMQD